MPKKTYQAKVRELEDAARKAVDILNRVYMGHDVSQQDAYRIARQLGIKMDAIAKHEDIKP